MAIRIIEGKIGSGKTYYAVNHVFREWYKWCDETDAWVIKTRGRPARIYTNIRNMKLGLDLDWNIKKNGGMGIFFHKDFQELFCKGANVIYIIDEAQGSKYFHRRFANIEVFEFFQGSRHYGSDIYLITQDVKCLSRELRELAEYHIVAVARTKSIGNCFTYKFYSGREHFKTKRIKKDNKVFNLYTSMFIEEGEKVKSAVGKYIIYFVVIAGLTVALFKFVFLDYILGGRLNKGEKVVKVVKDEKPKSSENIKAVDVIDNNFDIVGKANGFYIVKTYKGLKRVKIGKGNIKNIGDQIKIDKL